MFTENGEYLMREPGSSMERGLIEMINHCHSTLNRKLKVLEIGSYRGESTAILMNTGLVEKIVCIDAWENGYDPDKKDVASYLTPMSIIERQFDAKMSVYNEGEVTKIKGKSSDVFSNVEDDCYDVVYIDGDHSYEGCKSDIVNYRNKVVSGGIIAGHDYGWPGITEAIKETIGEVDKTFQDNSWVKSI